MFERLRQVQRNAREKIDLKRLIEDCRQLLSVRGESNSLVIAGRALERFERLSPDGAQRFFEVLASDFDPDPGEVLRLAESYAVNRSPDNLIKLSRAAEPPRQELFRRLNRAPKATGTIVRMRAMLLEKMKGDGKLKAVDADFEHLLGSWFNPGFLRLVQVDWNSPAQLLEKIIQHEAVHAIDGWGDLRRRLEPDRRCFAFFHPVLPDEPLIFVEVALLPEIPSAIAPLIDRHQSPIATPERFKVAAFYSISNCQPGLRGVNLGNFLIKQVAERLQEEFPKLRTFCTLSPIPSFGAWLARTGPLTSTRVKPTTLAELDAGLDSLRRRFGQDLSKLPAPIVVEPPAPAASAGKEQAARTSTTNQEGPVARKPVKIDADHALLQRLATFYLSHTSFSDAGGSDPVARFHLNNGARLERINPLADLSKKGLRQAHGMMVNYLYDLEEIEGNHERFADGEVPISRAVQSLL